MLFKEVTVFAYLPNVVGGGIAGIEDRTPFQYDTFADWKGGGWDAEISEAVITTYR